MVENKMDSQVYQAADEVRANWGWLMFMGIALVVLGVIGLYMAGTLTIASVLWFGILVIAGGILTLVDAFQAEGWKAKLWEILIGLVYIVAGIVMVVNPGSSAVHSLRQEHGICARFPRNSDVPTFSTL